MLFLSLTLLACYAGGDADDAKADDTAPDGDADTDSDTDTDTDADGDTDADSDADSDTDADGDADLGDSDGDGLTDGDEKALGTDPLDEDSDDDSYLDGDEVAEGHDPLDAEDRIYEGYWPYQREKDALSDPGWGGTAKDGVSLPRFAFVDQYGDTVDIYDFAMHGRLVAIDLCTMWASWCAELSSLVQGSDSALDGHGWEDLASGIADGDLYWVTVLDQDYNGLPPDAADVAAWYASFPNPHVPVLADAKTQLLPWMDPVGYPSVLVVDEYMQVVAYDDADYGGTLDYLVDHLP